MPFPLHVPTAGEAALAALRRVQNEIIFEDAEQAQLRYAVLARALVRRIEGDLSLRKPHFARYFYDVLTREGFDAAARGLCEDLRERGFDQLADMLQAAEE